MQVLNKNETIINAGYWVLSENRKKIIRSKKNQSVLIAKTSSRKTQKIANLQKLTPAKISCHTVYAMSRWGIGHISSFHHSNFRLFPMKVGGGQAHSNQGEILAPSP